MPVIKKRWKVYLKKEAAESSYDLGWMFEYLKQAAIRYHERVNAYVFPAETVTFKGEIDALLRASLKKSDTCRLSEQDYLRLLNEFHKLLTCSLASNRTPEEIYSGLKDDKEMREEVIEMLIKRMKLKTAREKQKILLDNILSGESDFGALLIRQKRKKGFPYNIR